MAPSGMSEETAASPQPAAAGSVAQQPVGAIDPAATGGRLPPELVQKAVQAESARLRACYEQGLRRDPGLRGRVSTQFVIGVDGAVSQVRDAASTLPDRAVIECISLVYGAMGEDVLRNVVGFESIDAH